jgi:isopenicillin N synthase-like dioxygenase
MSATTIPLIDWRKQATDREGFMADVLHALGEIGFMVLTNAPGFEPEVQARTMAQARAFFASPVRVPTTLCSWQPPLTGVPRWQAHVKDGASITLTPHFRGHDPIVQSPSQLVETFQYG